ncbi:hypothetical protein [Actinomyces culturomici]|uniref:hypothetical protein n=1 Tax=Actinomyces culturomici TaxID=1926276 RepID=UPI000E1FEADB|nr:hypothetical protein [Actinomyces culturomici]
MVFVRKVPGRNGAVKVQIAERRDRRDVVLEHVGTAHNDGELAALLRLTRATFRSFRVFVPVCAGQGRVVGDFGSLIGWVGSGNDAVLRPGFDGGSDDRKDHCAWDRGSTRWSFVSGRRG